EYEVERIVGHQWDGRKKKIVYQVRWKGFGPFYDTKQVEKDLKNAPDVLAEYKREHGL
ncbi:hypothetical protein K523DRAFT_257019, partial [Schizophyllum commune Tattone D]